MSMCDDNKIASLRQLFYLIEFNADLGIKAE